MAASASKQRSGASGGIITSKARANAVGVDGFFVVLQFLQPSPRRLMVMILELISLATALLVPRLP